MTTYKSLYHLMVRSMSEAIDLYDAGKGILARKAMKVQPAEALHDE